MSACSYEDYALALTIFSATLSGQNLSQPKLLSSDNDFYIPERNLTENVENIDNNLSSTHQVTFPLISGSVAGHRIKQNFITTKLPRIVATKCSDSVGYCSMPGLEMFQQFEVKHNAQATEIISACLKEISMHKILGDGFSVWAEENFGGINGCNQQIETCQDWDDTPNAVNVLKQEITILIPTPAHIFRNKEKFTPTICRRSQISVTLVGKKLVQILNYNKQMKIQEPPGFEIKIYNSILEHDDYFADKFVCIPSENELDKFFVVDKFLTFQQKDVQNKDTRVMLKPVPTTELWIKLYDNTKSKGSLFLAATNEDARCRYWESMLKAGKLNISALGAIELNKLLFVNSTPGTKEDTSKDWHMYHIVEEKDTQFTLDYNLASSRKSQTVIKSNIPFTIYPDEFYLDLATWSPTNLMGFAQPFLFSQVELYCELYDEYEPKHKIDKENYVLVGGRKIDYVPNGLLRFIGTDNRLYVLVGVRNLKKNRKTDDFTYDVIVSDSISSITNTASVFAEAKFINLTREYCAFYDLSCTHPIRISDYVIEGPNGEIKKNALEIKLDRNKIDNITNYPYMDYQIHIKYDYTRDGKETCGFKHIGCERWGNLRPTVMEEDLVWDKNPYKLSVVKDPSFLSIAIAQETLRVLNYNDNLQLSSVSPDELLLLTQQIVSELGGPISRYYPKSANMMMTTCPTNTCRSSNQRTFTPPHAQLRNAWNGAPVVRRGAPLTQDQMNSAVLISPPCQGAPTQNVITQVPCNYLYKIPGICSESITTTSSCEMAPNELLATRKLINGVEVDATGSPLNAVPVVTSSYPAGQHFPRFYY